MNDFIQGFAAVFKGMQLLTRPQVRRFVLIPLALNLILFAVGFWYLYQFASHLLDFLPSWLVGFLTTPAAADGFFAPVINWLLGAVVDVATWLRYLFYSLIFSAYMLGVFYIFSMVANLLGAPFNGYLAAAVERQLLGQKTIAEHIERPLGKEILATTKSELGKLWYSFKILLPLGFLSLILWVSGFLSVLIAPLWFLYGAWMLSVVYLEYPLGNYAILLERQLQLQRRHRALSWGFGVAALILSLLPIVNFIAMPAAVAGACHLFVKRLRQEVL